MDLKLICCVAFLPLILAHGPPGPPPGFEECKSKLQPAEDDIKTVAAHQIPESQKAKCFMACVYKAMGVLNADNSINLEKSKETIKKMTENLPPMGPKDIGEKMITAISNCKTKEKIVSDECEAAKNIAVCFKEQKKELGIPEMGPPPPPH